MNLEELARVGIASAIERDRAAFQRGLAPTRGAADQGVDAGQQLLDMDKEEEKQSDLSNRVKALNR